MSEPGKYVLLRKVQSTSKQIKKGKNQQAKKLKKKLQEVQSNTSASTSAKKKDSNPHVNENVAHKKKKSKQKSSQKSNSAELNVPQRKNHPNNVAQFGVKNKKPNQNSIKTSTGSEKSFGDDLSDRLKASRFRFINEQLYTQNADQALEVFEQDESAFTTYHEGYRKQIEQWPINPLDRLINSIKKLYVSNGMSTVNAFRFISI